MVRGRHDRCPLRLALGLALLAGLASGGPGAALDRTATVEDSVATVELASLNVRMEAIAATGQRLYHEAGRLLVHLAKTHIANAALPSEAIEAIRTVTQGAHQISLRSRRFDDAFQVSSARVTGSNRLDAALSRYGIASEVLAQHSERILDLLETIQPQRDPAIEADALHSFVRASEAYETAQHETTSAISALEDMLLPPTLRDAQRSAISLSVYGFADGKGAEGGYGLYTHVLFPMENDRNVALMNVLLRNPAEDVLADEQGAMNLFALPVHNKITAQIAARTAANAAGIIASQGHYDYLLAKQILASFCVAPKEKQSEACSSDWKGPFFLSYPRYLNVVEELSNPYLLVDLSAVHEAAFGEFVRAVKQQVMLPDFASREKIDTFRLQLLDITLDAADWILPVKEGIAGILSPAVPGVE